MRHPRTGPDKKHAAIDKRARVAALAERPGTPHEGAAARAALTRLPEAPARGGRRHLDAAAIRGLPVPATGNKIYFDDDVTGLGVRVTAKGARTFVFNYRTKTGRQGRTTIGACSDWSCSAARTKAKELARQVDNGGDPQLDIDDERRAPSMSELCDRFEAEHLLRKRPSTAGDYRGILNLHVRPFFGPNARVADVEFADIDRLHRKITAGGARYVANRAIAVLSKMFNLAIRWGMRDSNPAKGIERNTEFQRRRYLAGDELARLITALAAHPHQQAADIIRALMLTGARKGEVLAMRWADLDLGTGIWSKAPSSTKQNRAHQVPIGSGMRQLLAEIRARHGERPLGEFVFPGEGAEGHVGNIKKSWGSICRAANIDALRVHDLRHNFASQLASGGASLPLIGALLGHSNPSTTSRYTHLFHDPMRAAAETVGAIIDAAGAPIAPVVKPK